jgi:hypothetical protein
VHLAAASTTSNNTFNTFRYINNIKVLVATVEEEEEEEEGAGLPPPPQ